MPLAETRTNAENLPPGPKRSLIRLDLRNYSDFLGLFPQGFRSRWPSVCGRWASTM